MLGLKICNMWLTWLPWNKFCWRVLGRSGTCLFFITMISDHRQLHYLFNRLFRQTSKHTWKLHTTGLCKGNPPVTGGFPSHSVSNVENVSISWCHHVCFWGGVSASHDSLVLWMVYNEQWRLVWEVQCPLVSSLLVGSAFHNDNASWLAVLQWAMRASFTGKCSLLTTSADPSWPDTRVTNHLWVHNPNFVKIYLTLR